MKRMQLLKISLATLAVFASSEGHVQAQVQPFVTSGSTPQGDYLRGVGIADWGMGLYNLNTAQARSIEVDSSIRWSEYVAAVVKQQTLEYVARKLDDATKLKERYKQNRQRLLDSPGAYDVLNADALNRLLDHLQDAKIDEAALRSSKFRVPLSVDMIRKIPFKLSEKGERFSMDRLCLKGKATWPVAFQRNEFQIVKKMYELALDKALEQAIEGKMQGATLEELERRGDDLLAKLNEEVGQSSDPLYTEAKKRVRELQSTVRLLQKEKVERAIGEIERYSGTTVGDLMEFMQIHNLRFAAADTVEERKLLPELYASLKEQNDKLGIPAK